MTAIYFSCWHYEQMKIQRYKAIMATTLITYLLMQTKTLTLIFFQCYENTLHYNQFKVQLTQIDTALFHVLSPMFISSEAILWSHNEQNMKHLAKKKIPLNMKLFVLTVNIFRTAYPGCLIPVSQHRKVVSAAVGIIRVTSLPTTATTPSIPPERKQLFL